MDANSGGTANTRKRNFTAKNAKNAKGTEDQRPETGTSNIQHRTQNIEVGAAERQMANGKLREIFGGGLEPFGVGERVGAEGFEVAFLLVIK